MQSLHFIFFLHTRHVMRVFGSLHIPTNILSLVLRFAAILRLAFTSIHIGKSHHRRVIIFIGSVSRTAFCRRILFAFRFVSFRFRNVCQYLCVAAVAATQLRWRRPNTHTDMCDVRVYGSPIYSRRWYRKSALPIGTLRCIVSAFA